MNGLEVLYQILSLIAAGIILWFLYRYIKSKPQQLSRDNLSKSFSSMGVLALVLIAFVGLLVLLLNNT